MTRSCMCFVAILPDGDELSRLIFRQFIIPAVVRDMTRFSAFSLLKNALTGNKNWTEQWPDSQPKAEYDVVVVGAGGHGLGAAYYLAKEHGITNVAVIDKGWLGGGNTGRNTTIIRSNYLYDESSGLYDHAVDLWEGLSQELNYNVMYSRRGVLMLAHNVHDVQASSGISIPTG